MLPNFLRIFEFVRFSRSRSAYMASQHPRLPGYTRPQPQLSLCNRSTRAPTAFNMKDYCTDYRLRSTEKLSPNPQQLIGIAARRITTTAGTSYILLLCGTCNPYSRTEVGGGTDRDPRY